MPNFRIPHLAMSPIHFLIFLFCVMGGLPNLFSLVSDIPHGGTVWPVILVEAVSAVLFSAQAWMIYRRRPNAWLVSLAQVILYPLGIASTFGFVVRHVLDPIFWDKQAPFYNYTIFGLALACEILKTLYLRQADRAPTR